MTLIYVRRKSDRKQTTVSTQDPRRDEDYVGLAYQQLGKHRGKPRLGPDTAQDTEQVEAKSDSKQDIYAEFEAKFGKKVPNIKKNDLEWISKKLAE